MRDGPEAVSRPVRAPGGRRIPSWSAPTARGCADRHDRRRARVRAARAPRRRRRRRSWDAGAADHALGPSCSAAAARAPGSRTRAVAGEWTGGGQPGDGVLNPVRGRSPHAVLGYGDLSFRASG